MYYRTMIEVITQGDDEGDAALKAIAITCNKDRLQKYRGRWRNLGTSRLSMRDTGEYLKNMEYLKNISGEKND